VDALRVNALSDCFVVDIEQSRVIVAFIEKFATELTVISTIITLLHIVIIS